jgi:hypothetical protein
MAVARSRRTSETAARGSRRGGRLVRTAWVGSAALALASLGRLEVARADEEEVVIRGRVLTGDGEDAAGVEVAPHWIVDGERATAWIGTTTDAQGQFQLAAKAPRFPLPILLIDVARTQGALALVAASDLPKTLRLRLDPLAHIAGRLRCPDLPGEVAGVTVSVKARGIEVVNLRTPSSRFALRIPSGAYDLVVTSSGTQDVERSVDAKPGEDVDLGTLEARATEAARGYGHPAPPLTVLAARGLSTPFAWKSLEGKWVLLEFWSHASGASTRGSLRRLMTFHEAHSEDRERFEVLAFHDSTVDTLAELEAQLESVARRDWQGRTLPFPVLIDPSGETTRRYGVRSVPATYLIDPQGRLVAGDLDALALALAEGDPELASLLQSLAKARTVAELDPVLGRLGKRPATPRVTTALIGYAKAARGSILAPTLRALGLTRTSAAVDYLVGPGALKSEDPAVQEVAVEALESTGDPAAVDPLLSLAVHRTTPDRLVARALLALRAISPKDEHVIRFSLPLSQSPSGDVRAAALPFLALLETDEAHLRLVHLLQQDRTEAVRVAAALALGRSEDPRAREVLEKAAVEDRAKAVRAAAAKALESN